MTVLSGPTGLRLLAAWFDLRDAGDGVIDNEVQVDLRRWADEMEQALATIYNAQAAIDTLGIIAAYDLNVTDDEGDQIPGRPAVHPAIRAMASNALANLHRNETEEAR